jgi:putative heme-binding domain-containing protein
MKINLKPNFTSLFFLLILLSCQKSSKENLNELATGEEIYAEHVRTSKFQTPEEERLSFILPPGFEVTLFASEPDITKPINMAFDEKGRLWVTQSSEYPIAAGPGGGNDRITILEDTNGDGKADKIQDFANDLNIPIGIVPVKGGAIAYSIPHVYKFLDNNGDDIADSREILLGPFEHKDTHGMVNNLFRGFDGWIHASHGFSNISKVSGSDKDSIRMVSGNTFRFRMDGSRVEKTTDGRINPFGSDYDEMGYHYSADCHTLPIYQLIWGGNYSQWGKREPNKGFAPTMMDYGLNSTALSGLVYYTDNQFPEAYQNSFYSGDVVTCRISRNTMEFHGSTPKAIRQEDFLVSKDPWFRPVDIKIGPDGAMYVADFYNRIIGHYEVPLDHPGRDRVSGRIWKITYKGQKREITDWSKATEEELIQGMGHEVLHIRMMATDVFIDRIGKNSINSLISVAQNEKTSPEQYIQVQWALFRLDALPEDILKNGLKHKDTRVRVHSYKLLANYPQLSSEHIHLAINDLTDANPHVQRASAEMLSRHPNIESYRKLVELHTKVPVQDSHLAYTVLMALSNHLQKREIIQMALKDKWDENHRKLLALVLSDLNGPEAGEFLFAFLSTPQLSKEKSIAYSEAVARNLPSAKMDQLINWVKDKSKENPNEAHQWAIAMEQGFNQRGMPTPQNFKAWYAEIADKSLNSLPKSTKLSETEKSRLLYASDIAGSYKLASLSLPLEEMVKNMGSDEDLRASSARALMKIAPDRHAILIAERLYDSREENSMRRKFTSALGLWDSNTARKMLGEGLKNSPPELQESIGIELAKSQEGKTQLIESIKAGYAPARLLTARPVEEVLLANIKPGQRREYEELTSNLIPVSEERENLIQKRLAEFDPTTIASNLGGHVYEKNCRICHQIDSKGGLIGPQLDGVGNWGKKALATKILDPNRNISENFRTYNINLKNGQTVSGLYRREEGQVLVLANQAGEEFTVSRLDIREMTASKFTLMPDNFHTVLSKEEFDGLMAYLLNVK